jgi:hypothetical protein
MHCFFPYGLAAWAIDLAIIALHLSVEPLCDLNGFLYDITLWVFRGDFALVPPKDTCLPAKACENHFGVTHDASSLGVKLQIGIGFNELSPFVFGDTWAIFIGPKFLAGDMNVIAH